MMEGKCLIFNGRLMVTKAFFALVKHAAIVVYSNRWFSCQQFYSLFYFYLPSLRIVLTPIYIASPYVKKNASLFSNQPQKLNLKLLFLLLFFLPCIGADSNLEDKNLRLSKGLFGCEINDSGEENKEPTKRDHSKNNALTYCPGTPGQNIIEGTVFEDLDGDGILDVGETGESGIDVILYQDNNQDGLVDVGDTAIATEATDANGDYSFSGFIAATQSTFTVSASADDARETRSGTNIGDVNTNDTDLDLGYNTGSNTFRTLVGIRFQGVAVPQGAIIESAILRLDADNSDSSPFVWTIQGEDTDNATAFSSCSNSCDDISGRTLTSASVTWNNEPAWTDNQQYDSPDLTAIVQEIVNRSGWSSGNALAITILGTLNNSNDARDVHSFDNTSSQTPPQLLITYKDFSKSYVIATDLGSYPIGATLTTDNVETATFSAEGETECENDFGYVKTADVSLLKSSSLTNPNIGDTVIFSLKVINDGPGPALGIIVTDTLDASLTYVSSLGDGSYNNTTHLWTVPTIPNGDSAIIDIKTIVNVVGTFSNTAQVYSSTLNDPDSTPGNNVPSEDDQSSLTVTVNCAVIKKNLIMVKN